VSDTTAYSRSPSARNSSRSRPGEPDGTGRLPVWRLTETGLGAGPAVLCCLGRVGPAGVALLTMLEGKSEIGTFRLCDRMT
jgi:hypothetical protein